MTGKARHAVSILLIVLVSAAPAFALDPDEWTTIRKPDDPRAYEQVTQRFQQPLADQAYPTVFLQLQRDLEGTRALSPQDKAYKSLLQALTTLNERFATFDTELAKTDSDKAVDEFLQRIPTGLFQFPCPDSRCFLGQPIEVSYDQLEALPDEKAKDFLYRIETINRLLTDFKSPALKATLKGIRDAAKRWELFIREGRSQYPWEAAFNGYVIGAQDIQSPPSHQWVLFHPELGVEISTNAIKDLRAKESLLIDVVGHTWYRWRDANEPSKGLDYWGIAAVTAFRSDLRPGIGVMAHYGRFINVGVVWHDSNGDSKWFNEPPFFVMGIDLFRFAEYKAPQYQKRLQELVDKQKKVFSAF